VDEAREGKDAPAWFSVATVAPKYPEIKLRDRQSIRVLSIQEY